MVLGILALLATPVLVSACGPGAATASAKQLPTPIGGPQSAQDVNSMVGRPAPAFTLPDSDGKRYTVTPGEGKPTVLVMHMGIT